MRRHVRFAVSVFSLTILQPMASVFGADPPPAQTPAQAVLQQDVTEVSMDVVVRDKHAQPIRNLTSGDLRILDDGSPVEIKSFAFRPADKDDLRTISILVDSGEPDNGEASYKAVHYFLSRIPEGSAYFSAWRIDQHLTKLSDFTQDRAKFERAVWWGTIGTGLRQAKAQKLHAQEAKQKDESAPPPSVLASAESSAPSLAGKAAAQRHYHAWLASIHALIEAQKQVKGRKLIVYFNAGLPNQQSEPDAVQSVVSEANRLDTSVYIADMSGASARIATESLGFAAGANMMKQLPGAPSASDGPSPGMSADHFSMSAPGMNTGEFGHVGQAQNHNAQLLDVAQGTGGFFIPDDGELKAKLDLIADDLNSYYRVVYVPAVKPYDGHFRRVAMTVERTHANVQGRAGYFWTAPTGTVTVLPFEMPLVAALKNGAAALPFDAEVLRFASDGENTVTSVAVDIPFRGLQPTENKTLKMLRYDFAVLAIVRDSSGQVVQKLSEQVPYEAASERRDDLASRAYTFERHFALPAGDYTAEVAVEDAHVNAFSTRKVHFSIPATSGSALTVSDIALAHELKATEAGEAEENPLRYGDQTVTVWPSHELQGDSAAKLPVFVTVYPAPKLAAPDVRMEVQCDGKTLVNHALSMTGAEPRSFLVYLPENALSSGHYAVVVRARQGAYSAESKREFDFTAPPATVASLSGSVPASASEPKLLDDNPKLTSTANRPSDAEVAAMLAGARARALDYQKGLPNFVCNLMTHRFIDKSGQGDWKDLDTIGEIVRYENEVGEVYSVVQLNGSAVRMERSEIKGTMLRGEFGPLLAAVFSDRAKANVEWQGETRQDGAEVQVFRYSVPLDRSAYVLRSDDGTQRAVVAFHGLVMIDPNTLAIRRMTLVADNIPKRLGWKEAAIDLSYDYVQVGQDKFLLPVSGMLRVHKTGRVLVKNTMLFRGYRKFGSESRILP